MLPVASTSRHRVFPTLNDDVLTHIFYLNTHTPEIEDRFCSVQGQHISALDVMRHTSQVCQAWRHLILHSPSIWGEIIDLGSLNSVSNEWIDEVMGRTGEANLSIYGPVGHSNQSRKLLTFLVEHYWYRVRRFDIRIIGARRFDESFWSIFWTRPAPNLEKFLVDGYIPNSVIQTNVSNDSYTLDTDTQTEPVQLFSGSAPSLKRIHCPPNFNFDHHSTWISQLLSLTLSFPLTTIDAFKIIALCPLLESLVIRSTMVSEDVNMWSQEIYLPSLSRILISTDCVGSLAYLSTITPRSDCALMLTVRDKEEDLRDTEFLSQLSTLISPYAKRYFDNHCPTQLSIIIQDYNLRISSKTDTEAVYFGHPKFSINLRIEDKTNSIDPVIIDAVFSILASTTFKKISHLDFTISHLLWSTGGRKFLSIFRSLTAIKKVTLTPWALHALNSVSEPTSLFPCLTDVIIQSLERGDQYVNLEERLLVFLSRRKEAGIPVLTLDITLYLHIYGIDRWGFLHRIEGLKVLYGPATKRMEYICGLRRVSEDID